MLEMLCGPSSGSFLFKFKNFKTFINLLLYTCIHIGLLAFTHSLISWPNLQYFKENVDRYKTEPIVNS